MAKRHDVVAKVISQNGTCAAKHKVGDEWVIARKTPEGICLYAFQNLLPDARVLMFGGVFPWATDPDVATVVCPDVESPVVFELRRLQK